MKKFLFSSFLVASLASSLFGADLLASVTNGKLSDNSPGVKVLSLDEAKQVKGGYYYGHHLISNNEIMIYFVPELFDVYPNMQYPQLSLDKQLELSQIGREINKAIAELVTINTSAPFRQYVGYIVKLNTSYNGEKTTPYFSYGVGTWDPNLNTYHKINSSFILNNNMIVKHLRDNFKTDLEMILRGNRW